MKCQRLKNKHLSITNYCLIRCNPYLKILIYKVNILILKPFITKAPDKILSLFGINDAENNFDNAKFGILKGGITVLKAQPIFPRIDVKKEIEEIEKMMALRHKEETKKQKEEKKEEKVVEEKKPEISIDEFFKTELRVAEVVACEKVEKSNKLLKLTLKVGEEVRTVASGLANYYTAEELIGKKVILVYNLKPAKLCGVLSQGMVLCAEKDGKVVIVTPEQDMPAGAVVC